MEGRDQRRYSTSSKHWEFYVCYTTTEIKVSCFWAIGVGGFSHFQFSFLFFFFFFLFYGQPYFWIDTQNVYFFLIFMLSTLFLIQRFSSIDHISCTVIYQKGFFFFRLPNPRAYWKLQGIFPVSKFYKLSLFSFLPDHELKSNTVQWNRRTENLIRWGQSMGLDLSSHALDWPCNRTGDNKNEESSPANLRFSYQKQCLGHQFPLAL